MENERELSDSVNAVETIIKNVRSIIESRDSPIDKAKVKELL